MTGHPDKGDDTNRMSEDDSYEGYEVYEVWAITNSAKTSVACKGSGLSIHRRWILQELPLRGNEAIALSP